MKDRCHFCQEVTEIDHEVFDGKDETYPICESCNNKFNL